MHLLILNAVQNHSRYTIESSFTFLYMTVKLIINLVFLIHLCLLLQNVKAVFDAAIRVVLQPPKQKKKKSKAQKACSIL